MAGLARAELRGWKEIAAQLQVSVRTVQRWEREFGLPVHRLQQGSVVVAFADELERWRETAGAWQAGLSDAAAPPANPGAGPSPGRRWTPAHFATSIAGLAGLVVAMAAALTWFGLAAPTGSRAAPGVRVAQNPDHASVMRGVVASSPLDDGRTIVVTLDRHTPSQQPDGKVDEGFLLQLDQAVTDLGIPEGYGEITVKTASLAIVGADGTHAAFVVSGQESREVTDVKASPLMGLARYPDLGGVTHADFVARFSGSRAS
jgi:hypothetical protein